MITRRAFVAGALALPVVAALPVVDAPIERIGRFAVSWIGPEPLTDGERWGVRLWDPRTGETLGASVRITEIRDVRNLAAARSKAREILRRAAEETAAA